MAAPATDWFVAEGTTGPFFDTYLLLSNPGSTQSVATIRYLRPGAGVVTQTFAGADEPVDDSRRQRSRSRGYGRVGQHHGHEPDHRRARNVLARPLHVLVRGAQQCGRDADRHALGAGRGRDRRLARREHVPAPGEPERHRRAGDRDGAADGAAAITRHDERAGQLARDARRSKPPSA